MLETKNLTKIYKPKKGVPVKALDGISLKFPERGMVFLLGKSGSGKSTMLNVLGGLDRCDGGEIIIKGVSSGSFSQQRFDSYRNTYVGFIFQEYNVLEEFTVGANVALALELQGKKAGDDEINDILRKVDLDGYGQRKPNELSGGQKQRVAIARALVKDPQIIMADEPTGALDSATGRQIFDTLKKLSLEKLVIVVSHDRDFAEKYADRIIELSDGHVISDMEHNALASSDAEAEADTDEGVSIENGEVSLKKGYHLTDEDVAAINAYLASPASEGLKIKAKTRSSGFTETDEGKIAPQDPSSFRLIKSRLPMKNAFKIGAGGLRHKKFRLVITVLLSCIAFTLFGLADTFGSYNHVKTCTDSIVDTGLDYVSVAKAYKMGSGAHEYWSEYGHNMTSDDISSITKSFGISMNGVFIPSFSDLSFISSTDSDYKYSESSYNIYAFSFNGFAGIDENIISGLGYKLCAGSLPDGAKNEIAVSAYVFETFRIGGYANEKGDLVNINSYGDLIGKTLTVNGTQYTVCGIVDTGLDLSRYTALTEDQTSLTKAERLVNMALNEEFTYATQYSLACTAMVGNEKLAELTSHEIGAQRINRGSVYYANINSSVFLDPGHMITLDKISNNGIIVSWIDSEMTELGEKDIIITSDMINAFDSEGNPVKLSDYSSLSGDITMKATEYATDTYREDSGYRIVGVIDVSDGSCPLVRTVVTSQTVFNTYTDGDGGMYCFAVGKMPEARSEIGSLVEKCYAEDTGIRYPLQNSVTYELDSVHIVLKTLSGVFFYIGLGFALFAAIMLANFIATSISYKKQEIGILRAIGSRSNDVFRIFFSESFIIALTNFVLSCAGTFAATMIINYFIRARLGILITILSFGIRQIALLLVVSMLIAALASFIPVKKIASKKPIDAIRGR